MSGECVCKTCIYYADFEGICVCGECEWRADFPPTGLAECGCYERKENEVGLSNDHQMKKPCNSDENGSENAVLSNDHQIREATNE